VKKYLLLLVTAATALGAASTINVGNRFGYGANIGWMDWRPSGAAGAAMGEYVCSGFLYAANAGWINLGSGSPANGIRYQNNSATDFGVSHDGLGNLRGFAWGANIGWINFEETGAARMDLNTGRLDGYAWSANAGWISLSNAFAFAQTDVIASGADTDGDGLTDAYELTWAGNLTTMKATTDSDGDGFSDLAEYLADTNPFDSGDNLRITSYRRVAPDQFDLTWRSRATRRYHVQLRVDFDPSSPWNDSGLGLLNPDPGLETRCTILHGDVPGLFFRVDAIRPLAPSELRP
jgi:hypothetical protein